MNQTGNIKILESLHVPRAEDLPYMSSPPIQFVYESEATLSLGTYTFSDTPSALVSTRPLLQNALYYFRNVTLTADIPQDAFNKSITAASGVNSSPPSFQTYLQSTARSPMFREALVMNNYYNQFDYRLFWETQREDDQLFAGFTGTLVQVSSLIGVSSVRLKAVIAAQEIISDDFIENFKQGYPKSVAITNEGQALSGRMAQGWM